MAGDLIQVGFPDDEHGYPGIDRQELPVLILPMKCGRIWAVDFETVRRLSAGLSNSVETCTTVARHSLRLEWTK